MSSKQDPKASTLFLKDIFQNLRERMSLLDDNGDDSSPAVFEALEPRLLLSANPLSELEAKMRDHNPGALLNDNPSAIYVPSDSATDVKNMEDILAERLAGSGLTRSVGPVVEIIHDAPAELRVGDTINFFVQATDSTGIAFRSLTINGEAVALDSAHSAAYTFTAPGTYEIVATAENSGGISRSTTTRFTIEAEAPVVNIAHNAGQSPIAAGQKVVFDLTASGSYDVDKWTLTINGQEIDVDAEGKAEYVFAQSGLYSIIATATDTHGNTGSRTMVVGVPAAADIEAPAVTIDHDAPATLHPGQTVNFAVTATDNVGVTSTQFTINGQRVGLNADGTAAYTFNQAGVYKIVATAFDKAGNIGMQTITLHVVGQDVAAPVVSIGTDANGTVLSGQTVTFTVNATDNVGVADRWLTVNGEEIPLDSSYRAQYTFTAPGAYVVVATATDNSGNIGMQTITITVAENRDTEAPSVDIVHNGTGIIRPGQQVDFTVVATDNVGVYAKALLINGQNITLGADGKASFTFNAAGTYTVMAMASDDAGNVNTKTIILTVAAEVDVEAPVVTIVHNSDGTLAIGQTVDFTVSATDNVGVTGRSLTINGQEVTLSGSHMASFTFNAAGTYTIVAKAWDDANNVGTQTIILTVAENRDTEAPVVSISHNGGPNIRLGQRVEFTVTATDNVGVTTTVFMINGQLISLNAEGKASYTFNAPGIYTAYAMAADNANNVGTAFLTFEVTVAQDVQAPFVAISHNSNGDLTPGQKVNFTVTASDNVGVVGSSLTINGQDVGLDGSGKASYVFTEPGTYTIIARAWDAANNVGTQTITFTVAGDRDIEAPSVDIAHNGGQGDIEAGREIEFTVIASDNVGVKTLKLTIDGREIALGAGNKATFTFASPGTYTVVAIATDEAGNSNSKTLILVVAASQGEDNEDPVVGITHNAGTTVYEGNSVEFTVKATDNKGVISQTFTINGNAVGLDAEGKAVVTFHEAGSYRVVSTATDAAGNTGSYEVTITVVKDTAAPTVGIEYSGDGNAFVGDTIQFAVVANDNDAVVESWLTVNDQAVELVNGRAAYTFTAAGTYTVKAFAKDAAGNVGADSVAITVTVRDESAPEVKITSNARETIYAGNTVDFTVTADDDIGVTDLVFTINGEEITLGADGKASFTFAAAGTYEIIAKATDASGKEGQHKITLTVVADTIAPVVVLSHSGSSDAYIGDRVTFTMTATDNDGISERYITVNGEKLGAVGADGKLDYVFTAAGTYTFIAYATDAARNEGRSDSVTITVTAKDETDPTVEITSNAKSVTYIGNTVDFTVDASDASGITARTLSVNGEVLVLDAGYGASFTFTAAGVYEIVATATDGAGNTGEARIQITVVADTEAPSVSIAHASDGTAQVGDTVDFTVVAQDNDAVTGLRLTVNGEDMKLVDGMVGITFNAAGTYVLIAYATDAAGNEGKSASVTIVVQAPDDEDPVVKITHNAKSETYVGNTVDFTVTATDNTAVTGMTFTVNGEEVTIGAGGKVSFTFTQAGNYEIVAKATDAANNVGESTIHLTVVEDIEDPVVGIGHDGGDNIIIGDTVEFTVSARDNDAVSELKLTLNDQEVILVDGKASIKFSAAGTFTLVATAKDAAGNTGTARVTITVAEKTEDKEGPVVTLTHDFDPGMLPGGSATFKVTARDNVGVDKLYLTVNGLEIPVTVTGPDSYEATYQFASYGTYRVEAVAVDEAGNTTRNMVLLLVKDPDAPTVYITHYSGNPVFTRELVYFTVNVLANNAIDRVELTVNGQWIDLNGDNVGTFTFPAAGTYTVQATVEDINGTVSVDTYYVTVEDDVTAPLVELSHNGKSTNWVGSTIDFKVRAVDYMGVHDLSFTINGEEIPVGADGVVSYTFTAAGVYEIVVTAIDEEGNVATKSTSVTIVADTTAPSVSISHNGRPKGIIEHDLVTFSIRASDNVGVVGMKFLIGSQEYEIAEDGTVSYRFMEPGIYRVTALAWDKAGNVGERILDIIVYKGVLDIEPPTVNVTHDGRAAIYVGNTVTFSVTANDNVIVIYKWITLDDVEYDLNTWGRTSFTFTEAGTYKIVGYAMDGAGNIGKYGIEVTVLEDTEAPTLEITHNGSDNILPGEKITFTVKAADNDAVKEKWLEINGEKIALPSGTSGSGSFTFTEPGVYEVTAYALDAAGNKGEKTITVEVMDVDQTPPKVTLTSNKKEAYVNRSIIFYVSATDNVGVDRTMLTIDGEEVEIVNGKYEHIFTAAGKYEFIAYAWDAAGNESSQNLFVTIIEDTVLPTVSVSHNGSKNMLPGETITFTVNARDNDLLDSKWLTINGEDVELDSYGRAGYIFTAAGTYEVIAYAKDAVGNENSATITVTIMDEDTTAPTLYLSRTGGVYVGQTAEFTLTASDNVGITEWLLTVADQEVTVVDGKATFVFTAAGTYTAVATVRDAAGNETTKSLSLTVIVDNVLPVVSVTHNGGSAIAAGKTVEFTVKATDNVGVLKHFLTINGETIVLNSDNVGKFTFAEAGTYEVIAAARDAMGNEGVKKLTITVTEDTTAPVVTLTHNGRTNSFIGNTVVFTASATDNVGVKSIILTVNGEELTLADGKASYTFTTAGTYVFLATATDNAGNTSSRPATIYVTEDKTAPRPTMTHDGGSYIPVGGTVEFTVTGTDNDRVAEQFLFVNDVAVELDADGKANLTFDEAGTYTFLVQAKDASGNLGERTYTIDVVLPDVTAPTVSLAHNAKDTLYVGNKVTFTVTANDDFGVAKRELSINGVGFTVASNGIATYTFAAPGTYEIIATAWDYAGNSTSTDTLTFIVVEDTELPVVSLTHNGGDTITAGTVVTFTVGATDNDVISKRTLTVNGALVSIGVLSGSGNHIFYEAGTYTVVATAWDNAGNKSEMEIILTVL